MDLSKVRTSIQQLLEVAKRFEKSKFQDQDPLNTHFAGRWTSIGLQWNAQGLGTYAKHPSIERAEIKLELAKMENPNIVHFTGAVHPSLSYVLNPYVQPTMAKPWGYIGSPGHPFEEEWWQILDKTPWQNYRTSKERHEINEAKAKAAVENALREFSLKLPRISVSPDQDFMQI